MWYDLLTLGVLMYAMFRGAMKGIVWQLATIAALVMCFFFSGTLSAALAPFIRVEPPLNQWIAMFILYLVFSFISFGVARVLHEMIESMRIESLDRHLGAILGLVKGGMFSLFLTFFLVTLSHTARETIINSESGYVAAVVIDRLDPVIPGDLHALLEPYLRRLDAPEIEREHREERFARDRDRADGRDSPDREDLADDREPVGDGDRLDGNRQDGDRLDGDRLRRDGDGIDPRNADARDRDRVRGVSDTRRYNDQGRLDGPRSGDAIRDDQARTDRYRRRDTDDGRDRPPGNDPARPGNDPARPGDDVRGADDPFSAADADHVPRRRPLRRDDRPIRDRARDADGQPTGEESTWLSSLPALKDELRQLALRVWRKTRPEHRRELTQRLSSSVPELIRKTLEEWANGRPATAGDGGGERADLENEIIRTLVDAEADRPSAIDDIEASLRGIPDDVALSVLRGWRADLRERDRDADADPRLTDRSSLKARIRRELAKSGVSPRSRDAATRDRFRDSDTR